MREETAIEAEPTGSAAPTRVRPLPPGFVLLVAIAAMSWAGPLVRFASAPALAIAAWRLVFSVALVAAILGVRGELGTLARVGGREWRLAIASGALLAAHFWSWIASLEWTSVASSVVLVSTQPIFVAAFSALFLGERASARQWTGIVVAVAGAAVIGWGDWRPGGGAMASGRAPLLGDLLALAGAVFASGYFVIGRTLRQRLGLWTYVGLVYGAAAVLLVAATLASPGASLAGHATVDWGIFALLAAGPMLVGHTGVNYALRYLPAYVANLAVLGEPIGAVLIAWLLPAIGETPLPSVLFGGLLVGAGLLLGAGGGKRHAARGVQVGASG